MSSKYYIMMDGQVFGPYSYEDVLNLGILSDTMICSDAADSSWREAHEYNEFRNLFIFGQPIQQYDDEDSRENNMSIPQNSVDRQAASHVNEVEFNETTD